MERRLARSEERNNAVDLYLEALRQRAEVEAVTISTGDGLLIAGVGQVDVERMGAIAAGSEDGPVDWDGRTLHVVGFELQGSPVYLATLGRPLPAAADLDGVRRILNQQ